MFFVLRKSCDIKKFRRNCLNIFHFMIFISILRFRKLTFSNKNWAIMNKFQEIESTGKDIFFFTKCLTNTSLKYIFILQQNFLEIFHTKLNKICEQNIQRNNFTNLNTVFLPIIKLISYDIYIKHCYSFYYSFTFKL